MINLGIGYEIKGWERVKNIRHNKFKLYVIDLERKKEISVYTPNIKEGMQILKIVIDALYEYNKESENKLYIEEILFIEPSYAEELIGEEICPMWHIYLSNKKKQYLILKPTIESKEEVLNILKNKSYCILEFSF